MCLFYQPLPVQACRAGLVHHLEHLLFYGADMNARNASGNTPLHVCAVNNQDSSARMLLFRGADRECLNYAGQTAYQVPHCTALYCVGNAAGLHAEKRPQARSVSWSINKVLSAGLHRCRLNVIHWSYCAAALYTTCGRSP